MTPKTPPGPTSRSSDSWQTQRGRVRVRLRCAGGGRTGRRGRGAQGRPRGCLLGPGVDAAEITSWKIPLSERKCGLELAGHCGKPPPMGLRVARNGVRGSDAPALRDRAAGDHLMGEVGWTRAPQQGRVGAPRVVWGRTRPRVMAVSEPRGAVAVRASPKLSDFQARHGGSAGLMLSGENAL
ncbi:hypothetical protein NN561_010188 [Cricetulus griseus]